MRWFRRREPPLPRAPVPTCAEPSEAFQRPVSIEHLNRSAGQWVDVEERLMGAFGMGHGGASRSNVRWLGKRQAAQVISGGLCLAACREERPAIGLQEANPVLDITRVAQIAVDRELGTKKR